MPASITASMLYNLVECPHRVTMDLFGDPAARDAVSPFVELLWARGALHEKDVIAGLALPYTDLAGYAGEEKERQTLQAMDRSDPLIYAGRLSADDLLGEPDLLRREGNGYIAGDIKSGAGEEGAEDNRRLKTRYAVQLGLYTDILVRLGRSAGQRGFILDVHGREIDYDFTEAAGSRRSRSLWDGYLAVLQQARAITAGRAATLPAYGSLCKNCHWYSSCRARLVQTDDLTLIPQLGRSKRDAMMASIPTIAALAACDPGRFIDGEKTVFPGVGRPTFEKFHRRAALLAAPASGPILLNPVALPRAELEIFFDIEVDPIRDVCYLHGFLERRPEDDSGECYVAFFSDAPTAEGEEEAFAGAWAYLQDRREAVVYYYSNYERTVWRRLQESYPDVCTREDVESLFANGRSIDLYSDVVLWSTDWPVHDYSLKTLARYLGFKWRDPHPSGAASIEWYERWTETGDPALKQRILEYNEDDCRATRVLLDGIRALKGPE
jgi:uncharacterized protein